MINNLHKRIFSAWLPVANNDAGHRQCSTVLCHPCCTYQQTLLRLDFIFQITKLSLVLHKMHTLQQGATLNRVDNKQSSSSRSNIQIDRAVPSRTTVIFPPSLSLPSLVFPSPSLPFPSSVFLHCKKQGGILPVSQQPADNA